MVEYNFLNDITKFGSNALSAANTLQRQVRAWVTEQVEYLIKSADLVTHDELNDKFAAMSGKIAELEEKIAQMSAPAAKTKKSATKAPAKKAN